jgi:hypothetical protein
MTETNSDTDPSIISRIPTGLTQHAHPPITAQGDSTTRRRPPMSQEQRRKLSVAQKAYVTTDPRWAEHRKKLADAQIAKRMTLFPDELAMVLAMRSKGRTFSYIQEEIGVCREVIRRELVERGYSTAPVRSKRRAKRGTGFWRSFD